MCVCVSHWAREELTPNSLRRETPGKVHGAYRRTEWPFRWFRRGAFPSSGASLLGGQFLFIFTVLPPGKPHSGLTCRWAGPWGCALTAA